MKTLREEIEEIVRQRVNSVRVAIARKTLAKTEKCRQFWIEVQSRDHLVAKELQSALDRTQSEGGRE